VLDAHGRAEDGSEAAVDEARRVPGPGPWNRLRRVALGNKGGLLSGTSRS
jgi:hypothetical protein